MSSTSTAAAAPVSWSYRITFGIAAIVGVVVFYFFFVGLGDGSIDADNLGMWFILLAVTGGVLFGGYQAKAHDYRKTAILILSLLAVPGLLYGLFILLVVASGTSWN